MKLFGSSKTLIGKTKTEKKVAEVVLVQCNLVDNQYQQTSEVLQTSSPNKSYAYLLSVESIKLVFLKTYTTQSLMKLS